MIVSSMVLLRVDSGLRAGVCSINQSMDRSVGNTSRVVVEMAASDTISVGKIDQWDETSLSRRFNASRQNSGTLSSSLADLRPARELVVDLLASRMA